MDADDEKPDRNKDKFEFGFDTRATYKDQADDAQARVRQSTLRDSRILDAPKPSIAESSYIPIEPDRTPDRHQAIPALSRRAQAVRPARQGSGRTIRRRNAPVPPGRGENALAAGTGTTAGKADCRTLAQRIQPPAEAETAGFRRRATRLAGLRASATRRVGQAPIRQSEPALQASALAAAGHGHQRTASTYAWPICAVEGLCCISQAKAPANS